MQCLFELLAGIDHPTDHYTSVLLLSPISLAPFPRFWLCISSVQAKAPWLSILPFVASSGTVENLRWPICLYLFSFVYCNMPAPLAAG